MTKQDILLQIINDFYKRAINAYYLSSMGQSAGHYMPDDPEEDDEIFSPTNKIQSEAYDELVQIAHQVNDPGLASELALLAEIYGKAIEINGGWNSINKAISNIINMYLDDEDNPQQEAVEDVLNEVVKDLRLRAGGQAALSKPDSPQIISQLKEVKNDYNKNTVEEEIDDLSKWQENAVSTFDYTGGVGVEDAGKGTGRGYSTRTGFVAKDWVQSTENERERYIGELANVKDPATKAKIEKLIQVLSKLKGLLAEEMKITDTLALIEPDPELISRLDKVKEEISALKKERSILKSGIRNFEIEQDLVKLISDFQNETDPVKKMIIEQQIALHNLSLSTDVGKKKERNWRNVFIKSLLSGDTNPDNIARFNNRIDEAAALKTKIQVVRKEEAAKLRKVKKNVYDPETGEKLFNKYDWDSIDLDGLVTHLQQRLATERITVKALITDSLKKDPATKELFKPFLDNVAKAANKKDKAGLLKAVKELKEKMQQTEKTLPSVVQYVISVRSSKFFYKFRDEIKSLNKSGLLDKPTLEPQEASVVKNIIDNGNKLRSYYRNLSIKTLDNKIKNTYYGPITEVIDLIVNRLEEKINPNTRIVTETPHIRVESPEEDELVTEPEAQAPQQKKLTL